MRPNLATTIRLDAADADTPPARRFDVGAPLLRAHVRDSDGAVLAEGIPTMEGILEYRNADGSTRRELVTRSAILDTARTVARAPVTLNHPAEGFVKADTAGRLVVGDVDGEVVVEEDETQGGFARVKVAVRRKDAIDAIKAGTHELSLGYAVQLDETPGTHPTFGQYDARQIGRNVNHLAIVERGRAGPSAALRVDSDDRAGRLPALDLQADSGRTTDTREDYMNPNLVLLLAALGVERTDNEDVAFAAGLDAAKQLNAEADKLRGDAAEADKLRADAEKEKPAFLKAKTDLEKMTAERDAFKKEVADLKAKMKDRKDAADLADLQALADKIEVKHDGLDLPALRVAVAKTKLDTIDADSPAIRVDTVIELIRADVADQGEKGAARADGYAGFKASDNSGAGDAERFYNPHLDAADEARLGTAGGDK